MGTRILGIDPGSRITGFGVIEVDGDRLTHIAHGVIELDAKESRFTERLAELGDAMNELMKKYRPQEVVIEKIFLGKNVDSAFKLGHVRGVVICESGRENSQVFEYATKSVKKGITGNGGASKEDVQFVLENLLAIKNIQRIDASDALAMAVYHGRQRQMVQVIGRMKELL